MADGRIGRADGFDGLETPCLLLDADRLAANVATMRALNETVDWERLFRIQGEFLRASLDRLAGHRRRARDAHPRG